LGKAPNNAQDVKSLVESAHSPWTPTRHDGGGAPGVVPQLVLQRGPVGRGQGGERGGDAVEGARVEEVGEARRELRRLTHE